MKLKQISIKRQEDDSFAIVAEIIYTSGSTANVILKNGSTPQSLKDDLILYLTDEDTLQVEVQYQLSQVS
jgi:hypothetical protein